MKIMKQDKVIQKGWIEGRGSTLERWFENISLRIFEPKLGWTKISHAPRGAFQAQGEQGRRSWG